MKPALASLVALLPLTGCANRPTAPVSRTPIARHTAPALSKTFGSELLIVSYPAGWWVEPLAIGPRESEYSMAIRLSTQNRRDTIRIALNRHRPNCWYGNADGRDLARMCATAASRHQAILQAGFVTIDRVRLAEVEHEAGQWHYLTLSSAKSSAKRRAAELDVTAVCPVGQWPVQRATVMAILGSMRLFSGGA